MSLQMWHEFCGHGENFTAWKDGDFGHCFEQLVVVCPTHAILAIFSTFYIAASRPDFRMDIFPTMWYVKVRVVLAFLLGLVTVIEIVLTKLLNNILLNNVSYSDIVTAVIVTFAWFLHAVYVYKIRFMHWTTWRGPVSMVVIFCLPVISTIAELHTVILGRNNESSQLTKKVSVYVTAFLQILYCFSLLPKGDKLYLEDITDGCINSDSLEESETSRLTRFLGSRYGNISQESSQQNYVAESNSNFLSKLTFHWVQPLMVKGAKLKIKNVVDIFLLPDRLNTRFLYEKFTFILTSNSKTGQQKIDSSTNGEIHSDSSQRVPDVEFSNEDQHSNITLLSALHKTFGLEYYSIGLLKLLADSFGFAGPILLNLIVSYIENKNEPETNGYIYASGLLIVTLLGSICSSQFDYLCSVVGLKIRTVIVTTIYGKSLSVSSVSINKFSTGQITNFMSTDSDRIVNFCPSFHNVWSLPFQIAVSLFLLQQQVGLAFLAGLGFAILLIPINRWLAIKIGKLSNDMMEQKDGRVKVMNEVLFGMRVVKFYSWESHFKSKVSQLRDAELKSLKGRKYLDAMCVYFWATTPVLISILTFTTYSLMGNQLTAAKIFTSLSLFLMLISPLNAFPWVLNGLMEAWISLKRVQAFIAVLDMDINKYYVTNLGRLTDDVVLISNGEFSWQERLCDSRPDRNKSIEIGPKTTEETTTQRLMDVNINISVGQFVGVIGKVGSGKSSLLNAILAEMCRVKGHVYLAGVMEGFAYASQEPWIQHATVRDNILFGKEFNAKKYEQILEACALKEDLQVFPAGDKTEIGENGVTLSGGQKVRISLARAIYQDKSFYLLDDPLAAVDAHVAQHIYQKCIMGLLRTKTRVLCTHHTKFLTNADIVIVMEDGKVIKIGPPHEVLDHIELEFAIETGSIRSDSGVIKEISCHPDDQAGRLVEEEEKETGTVKMTVYSAYWKAVGTCLASMVLLALFLMQASRNVNDWWLSYWVAHSSSPEPQHINSTLQDVANVRLLYPVSELSSGYQIITKTISYQDTNRMYNLTGAGDNLIFYLTVYGCLAGANSIFTLARAFLFAYGGICAARVLHSKLLDTILKAPMTFFDVTPIGRIINRFSSDVYAIDDALPFIMNIFFAQLYGILGTIVITCIGLPWFSILLIPLALAYYKIQQYYRHTSREIKRISSVTLSPVYAHFSETVSGLAVIRAFREQERFKAENLAKLDDNQRAQFAARAASSWLGFRLQMLGVAMVTGIAFIAVLEHHFYSVDPGLVGLAISYALSVTNLLSGVVSSFTETEKQMVSVERAQQYIDRIPTESLEGVLLPPPFWPIQGSISFHQVYMRYRDNLPFALKNLSLEIRGTEKIGIVGRTGSGKSSLFLVLFRMVEIHKGNICIDGIDLHHLDLKDIRTRLAIIPQDPFLFSGTVRENLDPKSLYKDSALWKVLERCHLKVAVERLGGMDADVGERGRHFSVGQRQLICLARALLTKAKVICIDEATASVDLETDFLIQQTIHTEFSDSTVLTIAHRINTIMDSDRILVMENGAVAELAPTKILLQRPDSLFYKLVHGK
ncbi:hypothetical protein CHS0354_015755 [Potamilus streckersoni]|uniref:ABC-type xenobiotic transporter n=1 Tax=Potamilus streckersoni TaxID=2493646 RepID=A0AAE0W7A1_9BIVA|nr:hypothetical protein CHS0354_015755 [Potamilus streckersoni]